jgi:DNA-binding NarL/FixJ family response regulator
MNQEIKFVLVEDHALVAEAWQTVLESVAGYKVLGIADNAEQALAQCHRYRPDIVFMDVNLNNSNGLEATEKITNELPKTRVIGLSMHSDIAIVKKFISLGAKGYLSKNASKAELIAAVTDVMNDKTYIANDIKDKYVNSMFYSVAKKDLSLKEIEIVKLITKGLTSKEMAELLFVSPRTVETHRHNILKKLGFQNAAQLSSWAIEQGHI